MGERINLAVFGELPDGTQAEVRFSLIPEDAEEEYVEKGKRALLDLHCEDIDSEVVS